MVYDDKVWAVVGGIDGPSTHLAEQVITKARLTLISPGSTDKTTNLINIPWMFSALPPDNLQTEILAEEIKRRIAGGSFLMLSAVDHDSHLFAVELGKSLNRRRLAPAYHYQFRSEEDYLADLVKTVMEADVETVAISADWRQSARLSVALREEGFEGLIFGGPSMGQRDFAAEAGAASEGVMFPLLYVRSEESRQFEEEFVERFGSRPDYLAVHTYDTVNLLIAAIHKAGLDRAAIREAVEEVSPWPGAAGSIRWDSRGSNSRAVSLGTVRGGQTRQMDLSD
jgi:branched-chain amino acid transport system substrate-binding protein